MVFRCDAKNFFLTYPQANNISSKQQLLEFLRDKREGVSYICVGQESHQDGNTHYHALIRYKGRFNCKNDRFFDFKEHHPNIQGAKHPEKVKKYVTKDGDFIEWGDLETRGTHHEACDNSTREEWEEYCLSHNIPYAFCESIWNRCHRSSAFTITDDSPYGVIGPELSRFTFQFSDKCLVLIGPTGCGKTSWAIKHAPKPALLCSHLDRLSKEFDASFHKSIIFDDMLFKHMPIQSQIHLCDYHCPRDIHCRYRVASIPAGITKIFTCNERPLEYHPAIDRRIQVYTIKSYP